MPKRREGRVYWRDQGGERRAYGDFRDFADVLGPDEGKGLEVLKPKDAKHATTDPDVAEKLATDRVKELESRRRNKVILGIERPATLKDFASHHLVEKAKAGKVTDNWLVETERRLESAVEVLGVDTDLQAISVRDVQRWADQLKATPSGRGRRCPRCNRRGELKAGTLRATCPDRKCGATWTVEALSDGTVRHYLNALSNLYRRAISEQRVPPGYNPVAAMLEKPTAASREARWLEIHEAALLLESARTYRPPLDQEAIPFIHEIIATFLLTGGRKSEVLGLAVDDVSFDRKTVTFRPHPWRRLKTATSRRTVPLWPQLEEILRAYVFAGDGPPGQLLFPATRTKKAQPVTDIRKALDAVASRAGWKAGEIRTKMFRHSYCAARLQTLDRGAPVSPWTVSREMGHGGRSLVDRIYGHLGETRHRSEVVEYRVEQHDDALGDRLDDLRNLVRSERGSQ